LIIERKKMLQDVGLNPALTTVSAANARGPNELVGDTNVGDCSGTDRTPYRLLQ
jgi:hypothetical protein